MKSVLTYSVILSLGLLPIVVAAKPAKKSETQPEVKIHVSPKGNDSNAGTLAKPLRTIARALTISRDLPTDAPRAIILADGTYLLEEPVKVTTADIAVSVRAMNRGKAVLTGAAPVTGWKPDPDIPGVLVAPMPFKPEVGRIYMLFDCGEPCELSAYPKKGRLHYTAQTSANEWQWLNYNPSEFPADFDMRSLDLQSAWLVLPQEWATTRTYMDLIDMQGHRLHMKSKAGMVLGKFNQGFTLMNTRLGLTEPGSWMYESESGKLRYRPRSNGGKVVPDCRLTRISCLFDIRDVSSFGLDGIVLEGCHVPIVTPNVWTSAPLCAAVSVRCSRRVSLTNCEIRNTAGAGVMFLKADACRVLKCDIHNTGASCVDFVDGGVGNVEVSDCELHHGGMLSASSPLLGVQVSNARIVGNHIHDGPGNGITLWSRDSLVADNHIHHVMKVQRDGGGLYGGYCWTVVKGNHVHDLGAWPCLYADEGSQHSDFTHNRCEHWWPIHMHCTRFCTVTNNDFVCEGNSHRFSFQGSGGGVFSDNRLYLGKDVSEQDYLSLESCIEWERNEVRLKDGTSYNSARKRSFKTGAKDPAGPLSVNHMPSGTKPVDDASYPTPWNKALCANQLASGGSMCGCPITQIKASWRDDRVWFRFRTFYNALSGYFACRNIGGHVWGHWDGAKLIFENGLEVEIYPDGFARANRKDVSWGPEDTACSGDSRTATSYVSIPLSALGIAADSVEGRSLKFNVCCHNEDHRISAWGWRPQGENLLTGRLEFLP